MDSMARRKFRQYLPVIFTALSSGGVIATGYFSGKAGIAIKEIALDDSKTKEEKKKEIIKEAVPAILSAGATIGCIISSNILGNKNANGMKTEMAAGYVLLQNGYNQYRKKIDEETNARVLKKISEEKVKEVTVPVYVDGKYPWCDMYHKDPWYATEGDVFWAELKTKEMLQNNYSPSLHSFYEILRNERGCDIPYVPNEEDLIWDLDVLYEEWETDNITFSNLYDETEDGGRIYTLDFGILPYPSSEVNKILKKMEEYYG